MTTVSVRLDDRDKQDLDALCAGIQAVLDEFLQTGSRPLYDLSCCDLIRYAVR